MRESLSGDCVQFNAASCGHLLTQLALYTDPQQKIYKSDRPSSAPWPRPLFLPPSPSCLLSFSARRSFVLHLSTTFPLSLVLTPSLTHPLAAYQSNQLYITDQETKCSHSSLFYSIDSTLPLEYHTASPRRTPRCLPISPRTIAAHSYHSQLLSHQKHVSNSILLFLILSSPLVP